jgi:hypothetical protein
MNDDDLKQTIENAVEQIGGEMMTEAQLSGFMAESKAVIAKSQAELEADKNRRAITEKDGVHKEWYEQAKKIQGPSELTTFVAHLLNDYIHDYGTICHACAAAAIAGAWTVDHDKRQGGITGFQTGAIMWEFISHWNHSGDSPMKLIDFEDMLYPQYEDRFGEISADTFSWLQKEAARKMAENPDAHSEVYAHWKSIVDGMVPFGYRVSTRF